MDHFIKVIPTLHGNLTFYFNEVDAFLSIRYHVSTIDKSRKQIVFFMVNSQGFWYMIKEGAPSWILDIEPTFIKIMNERSQK